MSAHRYEAHWVTGWGRTEPEEPDSSRFLFSGNDLAYVLHFAPAFAVAAKATYGEGELVILDVVAGQKEGRNVRVNPDNPNNYQWHQAAMPALPAS